jgi:hypothetical protein
MPSLDIDKATVGYKSQGVGDLLTDIRMNVVEDAATKLENGAERLMEAVNTIWVGNSADQYKTNLQNDVKKVCKALRDAYSSMEIEITNIGYKLSEVDNQLVKARN